MKPLHKLLAALLFLGSSSCFAQAQITYPIYSFFLRSAHTFETTSYGEGARASGTYYGVAWQSVTPDDTTHPVYRCVIPGGDGQSHFASTDSGCEGQRSEGIYGYVYNTQKPGTIPLLRYYAHVNAQGKSDHITTTDALRQDGYYWLEGGLGFVYPVTVH